MEQTLKFSETDTVCKRCYASDEPLFLLLMKAYSFPTHLGAFCLFLLLPCCVLDVGRFPLRDHEQKSFNCYSTYKTLHILTT